MTAPNTTLPPTGAPAQITILPSGNTQGEPAAPLARPGESAVERATREARERQTAGQSLIPEPKKEPARDPRNGQFTEPGRLDQAREIGSPKAGQAPPTGEPQASGTEPPPPAADAAAGQPEAQAGEVETDEETEKQRKAREAAEAASERVVTILGRNDQEFELELPEGTPREVVDAVRHLRNSAMRAQEIRAAREEIEQRAEQMAQAQAEIELDPTGYLMRVAEESPIVELEDGSEVHLIDHTILHLITQPKVWERLNERLAAIVSDENERRIVRAETAAQRSAIRDEMRSAAEDRAVVSRNLQDVQATVGAILPTDWSAERQQVVYRDCLRDLKEYADRNRLKTIPVNDISAILAHRLAAYGINPTEAATRAAEVALRRGAAAQRRPAHTGAGEQSAPARKREEPPKSGQRFVVSAKKKGEAGAIPPGGAGSPGQPSTLTAPLRPDGTKMGIQETVQWHRDRLKTGQRSF